MNRDDTKESVYRYEKGFQGRTSRVYDRVPCERAKDGAYDPGGVFADAENGHTLVCGARARRKPLLNAHVYDLPLLFL